MKLIQYLIIAYFSFVLGKHIGYRDGVESEQFDRTHANNLLQTCLKVVRHD